MRRSFVGRSCIDVCGAFEETRGTTAAYDPSAALLRSQLFEAERELRNMRGESLHSRQANIRLQIEAKEVGTKSVVVGEPRNAVVPLPPDPTHADYEVLASYHDPPPNQLRRLGEALTLLLEARTIVSLGDHPLPGQIPWKNVQALLLNTWEPRETTVGIRRVLAERPWGPRLVVAVHERLLGGQVPVTRHGVQQIDKRCTCLFDFVQAFAQRCKAAEATLSDEASSSTNVSAQESISSLIVMQEKEVARLRRLLREAENANSRSPAPVRVRMKPLLTRSWDTPRPLTECLSEASTSASSPTSLDNGFEPSPSQDYQPMGFVGCCKALQYRLNDTSVPRSQEAVLAAMLSSLGEPRVWEEPRRLLEVIGFSEHREDPETALWRAEAVREWFLVAGVSEDMLRVTVSPSVGSRGSRRVELRLLDNCGGDGAGANDAEAAAHRIQKARIDPEVIRSRGEEYFARIASNISSTHTLGLNPSTSFGAVEPITSSQVLTADEPKIKGRNVIIDAKQQHFRYAPRASPKVASDLCRAMRVTLDRATALNRRKRDIETIAKVPLGWQVEGATLATPTVTIASFVDSGQRRLRVEFSVSGLSSRDANLEVGSVTVRLASMSGLWASVEIPLPFAVQPVASTQAARFSRKSGMLTLWLYEAAAIS